MSEKEKRKNDEARSKVAENIIYCLAVLFTMGAFLLLFVGIIGLIAAPAAAYWTQFPLALVYFWAVIFIAMSGAILFMISRSLGYSNRQDNKTLPKR